MPEIDPPYERFADEIVMTLEEAAEFLRVAPEVVTKMAHAHDIPAQRLGNDWRFLKSALVQWLKLGRLDDRHLFHHPFWVEHPLFEKWFHDLEQRLVNRLKPREEQRPKPGSKEAVFRRFPVFTEANDYEEVTASIAAMRAKAE